jgi:anti-anti-sigma factor
MNERSEHLHRTVVGGVRVVRVVGELPPSQRQTMDELGGLLDGGSTAVLLDLRQVTFMGSAGIALLVNAHHSATRRGVAFAIVADNRTVLRPLKTSQVDSVLPLHTTVDAAAAAIRLAET